MNGNIHLCWTAKKNEIHDGHNSREFHIITASRRWLYNLTFRHRFRSYKQIEGNRAFRETVCVKFDKAISPARHLDGVTNYRWLNGIELNQSVKRNREALSTSGNTRGKPMRQANIKINEKFQKHSMSACAASPMRQMCVCALSTGLAYELNMHDVPAQLVLDDLYAAPRASIFGHKHLMQFNKNQIVWQFI